MIDYEEEIQRYAEVLGGFIEKYELPSEWFKMPDHLAIKCADALDYDYTLQELLADARQASQIDMDKRRLAALWLVEDVEVGALGKISWLEIMEPRPEKAGNDLVGLEHMEFYFPNFDEVRDVLDKYKISYTEEANPGHAWINIVLNEEGQELKLNNKLLADTIIEELENGEAQLIGI